MATSKSTNTYNRQNWESSDFPVLCQTCLGDNPYIRMTKEKYGKECKICTRPFTVFRWCPGAQMRFKKTEVCQTCSKLKNVCQTCLLDLEYGLPTQVRDEALSMMENMPKSDVNKEFYIQNMERELANTTDGTVSAIGKSKAASEMLHRLARTTPYYKRNRPHICSFWVKGECKRGEECPYRHEKPTDPDDPLADQNIKDRYYGVNDPVAHKLMKRADSLPQIEKPEDKSITTLYVGNLGDSLGEKELRDYFYQFGEVRSVAVQTKQQFAFVTFAARKDAELAAEKAFNKVSLAGRRLNIKWGKAHGARGTEAIEAAADSKPANLQPVPGLPTLPPPPESMMNNFFNLGGGSGGGGDLNIPLPPGTGPENAAGGGAGGQMPLGSIPQPMNLPPLAPPSFFPVNLRGQLRPRSTYFQGGPPLPGMMGPRIHYPSQDPTQMGALPPRPPMPPYRR